MPKKRFSNEIVSIIQRNPKTLGVRFCRLRILRLGIGEYHVTVHQDAMERFSYYDRTISFPISEHQVKTIGKSIVKFFDLKVKEAKFKPTRHDFEKKLKETHGEDWLYMWVINQLRLPWNKKVAKRLYEWLKGAETMGFFKGEE